MASNETIEEVEKTIEETQEAVKATEIKFNVEVEKKKAEEAITELKKSFSGLKKTVDAIADGIKKAMSKVSESVKSAFDTAGSWIEDAFTVTSMEEYEAAAEQFGEDLAGSLYFVQQNMSTLKTSIVDAVAPIAAVAVPGINDAILAVTDLANGVGRVIGALFGSAEGADALAHSAGAAAESAAGTVKVLPETVEDNLSPQLQTIVEKIQSLVMPLAAIDFTPIVTAFGGLQTALVPLTQELFAGLEWAYLNLLVPLAAWTTEGLLPGFLDLISGAMSAMNEAITALQPLALWLWDSFLQPIAEWTGGVIVDTLQWLADKLTVISTWISENQALIEGLVTVIGSIAAAIGLVNAAMGIWNVVVGIWNGIGPITTAITGAFGAAMNAVNWPVVAITAAIAALIAIVVLLVKNWDTVKEVAFNTWEAIKEAFGKAGAWFKETVLDPLVNGFKSVVNGIIGFINWLIEGAVKGINGVIGLLNKLQFTVPDWVPGLGGKTLGFNLKMMTAPQIPYLAKGAVLPANKPFLAVVGDQRHGTNVEAPLTTIQEAVALVMNDHIGAMMAGFEALLKEQRATRQTIEGIEIGDTVIGRAAERYGRKMAVVRGGY